ncbi:class V lanthionine synthetase subunit LxmK [Streptomyces sp. cg2]|uniref:class V lanthionine synthetase subunit LxmK n=1 Tax=Streptomyces sp. cg2 TaxID=3238799 RepID=UPI0034E24B69
MTGVSERTHFDAPSLAGAREVEDLLDRLELGLFLPGSVTSFLGRNDNWAGETTSGQKIFVKKLKVPSGTARSGVQRTLVFQRLLERIPREMLLAPDLLGWDEDSGVLVFRLLDGARTGAERMVDETFDESLALAAGRAVGALHRCDPSGLVVDDSPCPLPSTALLQGLSPLAFDECSFAGLQAWRLLQQDTAVIDAVAALLEEERAAPKVPAHCDLRLDQFLISDEQVWLTDWEEFRLADAARDVGSFAGEWLFRSILDIVTTRGDSQSRGDTSFADVSLTHETVIARGVAKFERLRPVIEAFCRGYREARPVVDEGLARRAAGFAGWHLLDRLIAGADMSARLSATARAAAGVGRNILLTPEAFIATLGLEGVS